MSNDDPYRQNPSGRDAKLAGYAPLSRQKPPRLTRQDRRELLTELSGFPQLAGCDRDDLAALIKASVPCSLPAGWALIAQETPGDFCYVVLKGAVGVYVGREMVARLEAGALVGEVALLSGDLRSATVTSLTRVSTLAIATAELRPMLARRPALGRAFRHQASQHGARDLATIPPVGE